MNKRVGIFKLGEVLHDNEIEKVCAAVYLFSCYRKMSGHSTKILRRKLIYLLSLYVMYDYTKETKEKAAQILGVSIKDVNGYNHELRSQGYLVRGDLDERDNFLSPPLQKISEYVSLNKGLPLNFLVNLS